jgi:hypothetical protein
MLLRRHGVSWGYSGRGIIAAIHGKNATYLSPRIVDEFGYIYVVNRLNNSDLCITRKSVKDPYEPEN